MGSRLQPRVGDKMNLRKSTLVIAFAVISASTLTASIVSAQDIQNTLSSTSTANPRTIEGVWRTVVTPRNCQTGEPVGSLRGLFTFNERGTMSEWHWSRLEFPPCVAPATEFGGANTAGNSTRSLSRTTDTTRAAFSSDRRKLRLLWNSEQAPMSLPRGQ